MYADLSIVLMVANKEIKEKKKLNKRNVDLAYVYTEEDVAPSIALHFFS